MAENLLDHRRLLDETALKGIIKRAIEDGVKMVDVDYVKKLNDERK